MENNYIEVIAKNILFYRKRLKLTQEELASQFGISFQAVSKWESGLSMPDINYLPRLAKTFKITIDQLFKEDMEEVIHHEDKGIKIVVYEDGKIINQFDALNTQAKVILSGKPKDIISYANLEISDKLSVQGNITCHGNLAADNISCGGLTCQADMTADVISCGGLTVGGNITVDKMSSGGANVKGSITADRLSCGGLSCGSDINADTIECKDKITVQGNINCEGEIRANVINGDIISERIV